MMLGIRKRNYKYHSSRTQERPSYEKFLDLQSWKEITDDSVRNTLIECANFDPVYHKSLLPAVKHAWRGIENIRENYSQSWQDWFVLTVLDGKTNGYWLELGAGDPIYMNNTYLLESKFGWTGISIDFRDDLTDEWKSIRSTNLSIIDALSANWKNVLRDSPQQIDYLQSDLADWVTLEALEKLPHDLYRFSVITFEHDIFQADPGIQKRSRELLNDLGYHMLISNIAVKNYATQTWEPFEDWWVDPTVIDTSRLSTLEDRSDHMKLPHKIFLNL